MFEFAWYRLETNTGMDDTSGGPQGTLFMRLLVSSFTENPWAQTHKEGLSETYLPT
jgi:hypothetical protein